MLSAETLSALNEGLRFPHGEITADVWYKCWKSGDAYYAAFYNFGSETEAGSVPVEGGAFARQLVGPIGDCGMERGVLRAEVPPRTLRIFSIMQSPASGLYRNNVKLSKLSPGTVTLYAEEGARGAVYEKRGGTPELTALLHTGDTCTLTAQSVFKLFSWDAQMRPIDSAAE